MSFFNAIGKGHPSPLGTSSPQRSSPRLAQMSTGKSVAGTLAAVLEAVDVQKSQQQRAQQQETHKFELEGVRNSLLTRAWSLLRTISDPVTQNNVVQFCLDARCDNLPVRFYSDIAALSSYLQQQRILSPARHAIQQQITEPAVTMVVLLAKCCSSVQSEALKHPQLITDRAIAEFEFQQMMQRLDQSELQMLVHRYQMFMQCMEREV